MLTIKFTKLLWIVILICTSLVVVQPAHAATFFVLPGNPNWILFASGATAAITGGNPFGAGTGSLELTIVDPNSYSYVRTSLFPAPGTPLNQLSFQYSTYTMDSPRAVALSFRVDYDSTDGNNDPQGTLVYEPYFNGNVINGVWQTWTITPSSGKWWMNGWPIVGGVAPPTAFCEPGYATNCTLEEVLSHYPNAVVYVTDPRLYLIAGNGWPGPFTFYADMLTVNGSTFDFELTAPSGATTVDAIPEPPPAPRCIDMLDAGDVVRAGGAPYEISSQIYCRMLVINGNYIAWFNRFITHAGNVGVRGLVDRGVIHMVDVFSPNLKSYEGGFVVCLKTGDNLEMVYLRASGAPRKVEIVDTYTVPEFPGFTCLTIFEPGTLGLIKRAPQ